MKVLLCADYYLPAKKAGGPVSSLSNLCKLLQDTKIDICVLSRNHDFVGGKVYSNITPGIVYSEGHEKRIYIKRPGLLILKKIIKKTCPSVICVNSYFSKFTITIALLSKFGFLRNITCVLSPRGDLLEGALGQKKIKKFLFMLLSQKLGLYSCYNVCHVTSSVEQIACRKILGPKVKIVMLPNVPNLDLLDFKIVNKCSNQNSIKLCFLGRIHPMKNLIFSLQVLAFLIKKNSHRTISIVYDIYGFIEDVNHWKAVEKIISELNKNNNIAITYKGNLNVKTLIELSHYDALLLPTQTENFGHAIVECMLMGVIPIISDKTPWQNLQKHRCGYSLNLQHIEVFANAILDLIDMSPEGRYEWSLNARDYIINQLSLDGLADKYRMLFNGHNV